MTPEENRKLNEIFKEFDDEEDPRLPGTKPPTIH